MNAFGQSFRSHRTLKILFHRMVCFLFLKVQDRQGDWLSLSPVRLLAQ